MLLLTTADGEFDVVAVSLLHCEGKERHIFLAGG